MRIVTLIPQDKRAKQIVQKHGNRWEITQTRDRVLFSNDPGPWFLVTPITEPRVAMTVQEAKEDSASRWVHAFFDPRFKIAP